MAPSTWLEHRAAELRFALRMIRKTPGASAVAVLSLALGIGANTAIFSFVDTLLLKRLPVRAPEQLHNVARTIRGRSSVSWNYPDYRAFREHARAFSGVAACSSSQPLGFQDAGSGAASVAELANGAFVSGNYFDVLGVEPAIGRTFNAADDRQFGAAPYAVLSYEYWQRRFAGDPRVVGRTVRVNGYPLTVIGVARRGFRGVDVATSPNVFVPMTMYSEVTGVPLGIWNTRHYWWFQIVGRLAPGATRAEAVTQLAAIHKSQEESERRASPRGGATNAGQAVSLLPAGRGYSYVRNSLETPLLVLMVVVGVVLLIACANVASLMLARGVARQREMAVRLAVGASRSRLAGQLLVESIVLSLMGGVAGLAFAYACVRLLLRFAPGYGEQVSLQVSPDLRLLGFSFGVSVLTGIVFGLAPALQSTRPDLVTALKAEASLSGARSRVTLRKALVVAQVALSLLLVVGAGLFVRTLQNLNAVDLGLRPERTVVASIDPSRNGYKGQRLRDFYERLRDAVSRVAGVRSVTLATITPLSNRSWDGDMSAEGYVRRPDEQVSVNMNSVGQRYFETMGIPVLLGRDFRDDDDPAVSADPPKTLEAEMRSEAPGPRVAIVSESLAKHFFAGRSPIGQHVCTQREYDPSKAFEIVGVVKDVRYEGLRSAPEEMLYFSTWRQGVSARTLCLRTTQDAPGIVETLRRLTASIDPAVPVLASRTMQEEIDNNVVIERLVATLSSFFGGLALLLAAVGLYGVMAYTVSRRTREIGIRMALGAGRGDVLWLVLRGAAALVLAGAAIGIPAALLATRTLKAFLFGVTAQDPVTIAAGTAILAGVAALAALIPARRATAVQPTTALRCE